MLRVRTQRGHKLAIAVSAQLGQGRQSSFCVGAGLAVYLLGDILFRRVIGIGPVAKRAIVAVIALGLGAVGLWLGAIAELAAATLLMVTLLFIEQRSEGQSEQKTIQ